MSASWTVSGYTPNWLMPTALTPNEARQPAVVPGATLAAIGTGSPATSVSTPLPRRRYWSISSLLENWTGEEYSCTTSPAWVWPVVLLTVPVTVTVPPGSATCGLTASMTTVTVPDCATGRASAGWASASTMVSATANSPNKANRIRLTFAGSMPCTFEML